MTTKKNILFLIITTLLAIFLLGCTQPAKDDTFKIGFIPSERASELTPKAEKLGEFLEQQMGMEVEVIVPSSYEPLIEGLRFGHLDAAYMDSGPAWLAYQKADAEVVLAELKNGNPFYYGEVFVRKTSDIKDLEDVKGKRIAFTSWTGSSGFILPIGTMVNRGIVELEGDDFVSLEKSLQNTFESYTVAGGYKQALDLLVQGKVDVAGGAYDAPERFLDPEDAAKIKTLERLGKVPSHPIVVGSHLSSVVKQKFVNAMLQLNLPENIQILKDLYGVDGLVATNTQEHLGDFGPAFEALTGIHDKVFNKHIKDDKTQEKVKVIRVETK